MHGRIFQINEMPTAPEDYLSEDHYYDHPFLGEVADGIREDEDRLGSMLALKNRLETAKVARFLSDQCFVILPNGKTNHFATQYEKFVQAAKAAAALTPAEFASGAEVSGLLYQLNESHSRTFECYVCVEDSETITLDDFIRSATPRRCYYIGGVLDYHA